MSARPTWLDLFVDREIRDVAGLIATFADGEELEIGDGAIETDGAWFQIQSVHPDRSARRMMSAADIELIGEWGDRTGVRVTSLGLVREPFRVKSVHYAQRGNALDSRATIGAWLVDSRDVVRLGVLLDPEDVQVGDPSDRVELPRRDRARGAVDRGPRPPGRAPISG